MKRVLTFCSLLLVLFAPSALALLTTGVRQSAQLGVDGLFTDFPDAAAATLRGQIRR